MTVEICIICKHEKNLHARTLVNSVEICVYCCLQRVMGQNFNIPDLFAKHEFKLDNLQLVEDLAKERKLV
jgi:hypothetical protein